MATPETGVDSLAVTYALLDPIMTVARPVAAVCTAIAAGMGVSFATKGDDKPHKPQPQEANVMGRGTGQSDLMSFGEAQAVQAEPNALQKLGSGMRFAFLGVLNDIGPWFLLGCAVSGLITVAVPDGFIQNALGTGIVPMLVMLLMGLPMYVCATASTPLVAALVLKGLSPGAALVFLLTGPVTNAATLGVLTKVLGPRGVTAFLLSIAVTSLAFGIGADALYTALDLDLTAIIGAEEGTHGSWFEILAAIGLLGWVIALRVKGWMGK